MNANNLKTELNALKSRQLLLLLLILSIITSQVGCALTGTTPTAVQTAAPTTSPTSTSESLPALKISGDAITPDGGTTLADAKKLVTAYLRKTGTQGDIEKTIKVKEITTKEIWDNNEIQLFSVDLDYAWIETGVAVVKNGKVLAFLSGMPVFGIYFADLDVDKKYEIYTNLAFGSGIVSYEVNGYNPTTKKTYSLSGRFKGKYGRFIDYKLRIMDKILMISSSEGKRGELVITKKNGVVEIGMGLPKIQYTKSKNPIDSWLSKTNKNYSNPHTDGWISYIYGEAWRKELYNLVNSSYRSSGEYYYESTVKEFNEKNKQLTNSEKRIGWTTGSSGRISLACAYVYKKALFKLSPNYSDYIFDEIAADKEYLKGNN